MNIFTVLSQGNGRLNEENLSAMLAFLLSPTQTHGFGDTFLRNFLSLLAVKCEQNDRFDNILNTGNAIIAEILLESPYLLHERKKIIDIEIRLFSRTCGKSENDSTELHRIAIENKIRPKSAEPDQFREEFEAISQDIEDEPVQLTMVFLTPAGDHPNQNAEYENLTVQRLGREKKAWIRWIDQSDSGNLCNLLKQVLRNESDSDISPINEYVRHTLKALIIHIKERVSPSLTNRRNVTQIGDIVESALVQLSDGKYRIDRHESKSVRVFNLDTQEYEVTKPILRKINEEMKLGIELYLTTGRKKNTRNLGKLVIRELVAQKKGLDDK
jgi:hypothetical protein